MEDENLAKQFKTESLDKTSNVETAKRKGDSPKSGKKKPDV
jgi:hypothetical protein